MYPPPTPEHRPGLESDEWTPPAAEHDPTRLENQSRRAGAATLFAVLSFILIVALVVLL
jgi:hypothetical protein